MEKPRAALAVLVILLSGSAGMHDSCLERCGQVSQWPSYACNCDRFCPVLQDCCPDFTARCPAAVNQSLGYTQYALVDRGGSYLMTPLRYSLFIMECPPDFPRADIVSGCLKTAPAPDVTRAHLVLLNAQVYHRVHRLFFDNVFCAMCNGVTDLANLQFSVLTRDPEQMSARHAIHNWRAVFISQFPAESGGVYKQVPRIMYRNGHDRVAPKCGTDWTRGRYPLCPRRHVATLDDCPNRTNSTQHDPVSVTFNGSIVQSCWFLNRHHAEKYLDELEYPQLRSLSAMDEYPLHQVLAAVSSSGAPPADRYLAAGNMRYMIQIRQSGKAVAHRGGGGAEYADLCGLDDAIDGIFHCAAKATAATFQLSLLLVLMVSVDSLF